MKRPEKQHTVGAIALGTIVGAAITSIIMPEVIDKIVDKMYGAAVSLRPDAAWEDVPADEEVVTAEAAAKEAGVTGEPVVEVKAEPVCDTEVNE